MTIAMNQGERGPTSADVRGSVLVVDDDQTLGKVIERLLRGAGHEVVLVHDGTIAEATLKGRSFDVVLSDIELPGMSGVDLLRVVRGYDLDVPVILMTGAPKLETALQAISLGALEYLPKPTPNEALLQSVERAARLHSLARMKREALKAIGDDAVAAGDRAGLAAGLDRALATMWMAFQPIVDGEHQRVFGYEALMRAREPSLPHPGAILDAAERLGRLPELGRRVRQLTAEAFSEAPPDATLFVNLHTRDLLDDTLYDPSSGLSRLASRVVLEITERAALDDVKDVAARVSLLRTRGFRIAIDDLGAGYAGLSSFAAITPEIVKLDMSLVRDVHKSAVKRRLVGSMTALCAEMGVQVVAEGIENAGERDCVQTAGCKLLQGYLFAKPGPPFPTPSF